MPHKARKNPLHQSVAVHSDDREGAVLLIVVVQEQRFDGDDLVVLLLLHLHIRIGADGKGTTIWNGSRYPAEATDKLHHYSGALCMAADSSGKCASVFYIMSTLPGGDSITQELTDQMNSAGYRAEVVSAYQTVGGAPYLDYTDTVLGQVYEGMDVVDTIAQVAVDENQKPTETITINSVSIETYQAQ